MNIGAAIGGKLVSGLRPSLSDKCFEVAGLPGSGGPSLLKQIAQPWPEALRCGTRSIPVSTLRRATGFAMQNAEYLLKSWRSRRADNLVYQQGIA
jgi:hypothetical protein